MTDTATLDLYDETEDMAPPARRPIRLARFADDWSMADWVVGSGSVLLALASASFFTWSFVVSIQSPDYFQDAALANMPPKLDRIETGSLDTANAMPAPQIVRLREPTADDYQIVMVFKGEALLATRNELMRVKVGSVVPGLGSIRSITTEGANPTVVAENATLRSAPAQP